MAAGANEALVNVLSNMAGGEEKLELMASQLTGLLAATVVDGDVAKGAEIAKNATAYNQQVHRDALSRLKRGMSALHEQGKYADLEPETVLADLQKIASGEAKSVSDLNPKVVQFLNSEFSPASLRETLFEPESWEEYAAIAVDVLYPTPGGKAAAIEKAGGKLSKEALESLEKKFSESTKQELKSKLLQEDPRNLIPTQTKAEMSGSQIKRIVKSIKENGFDQEKPVDVWRNPKTGRLEIQDGHHRTEAAKKAGLDKIPVSIWE
ncbi:ParB/RepB/Spo0J family partition protein [Pseudomonas aeruginosa]|nr:ParB/RepB/Spo0J family partition protein [Pseudomonas aeruginosa]